MDMGVESLLLSWRALRRRGGDAVKGEEGEKLKLGKQKAEMGGKAESRKQKAKIAGTGGLRTEDGGQRISRQLES